MARLCCDCCEQRIYQTIEVELNTEQPLSEASTPTGADRPDILSLGDMRYEYDAVKELREASAYPRDP